MNIASRDTMAQNRPLH